MKCSQYSIKVKWVRVLESKSTRAFSYITFKYFTISSHPLRNPTPPSVKRQKSCGLTRAWLTPSPISWIDLLWFFFSLLLTKDTWSWFRGKNWWSVVREKWQCCCRWLWYCHVCRPWPRPRTSPPPGSPATPRSMWRSSVRSRSAGIRSGLIHLADLLS